MHTTVFVGGALGDVSAGDLPTTDCVIAADSGLHNALALGASVDLVIGDMDSVDRRLLSSVEHIEFPPEKDASDFELAVDHAIARGATAVTIVGGLGGRLDHFLAIAFGLCRDQWAGVAINAIMGRSRLYVVRDQISLRGQAGDYISQFAVNGPITDLRVEGLKWSGHYPAVDPGSSFCLSDEFVESTCRLSISSGTMLVVHELS